MTSTFSEEERAAHRHKVVFRNTFSIFIIYLIPSLALNLAKYIGLVDVSWNVSLGIGVWCTCSTLVVLGTLFFLKKINKKQVQFFTILQLLNWFFVFFTSMIFTHQAREFILFFTLLGGMFFFTFTNFLTSMGFSLYAILSYLLGTYIGVHYLQQESNLTHSSFISISYFPLAIFNSWIMNKYRKQSKELAIAQKNAELKPLLEDKLSLAKELEEAHRGFSTSILEAQEKERNWIAREIHDDFGQEISLMSWKLHSLENAINVSVNQELKNSLNRLQTKTRSLSSNLKSIDLSQVSLDSACEGLIANYSDSFAVDLQVSGNSNILSKQIQLHLFRILQECLNNTLKHAKANHVTISILYAQNFEFSYKDDGCGYDMSQIKYGVGIHSFQERAELMGASLILKSALEKGFNMVLSIKRETD